MKTILRYVIEYFNEEWNGAYFATVCLLLTALFVFNYGFVHEAALLKQIESPLLQLLFYFGFFSLPYLATVYFRSFYRNELSILRNWNFWKLWTFGFFCLASYILLHSIPVYVYRVSPESLLGIPDQYLWFVLRCASNIIPGILVFIPIAAYWYWKDRDNSVVYGFTKQNIEIGTYLKILLLIAPIVIAASFTSDFQISYPRFKFGLPLETGMMERSMAIGVFELCYGFDFAAVEFVFRGFFVMAFVRLLGQGAIMPMVVVYAMIHFQKPLGEAISSIVGGTVLGVIAYRTKSIYGGIILHLGVAYLMEISGGFHYLSSLMK